MNTSLQSLTFVKNHLLPIPRRHYVDHYFIIPAGVTRVCARLRYHRKRQVQLYISLFDPSNYRGTRMNLSKYGELLTELWVAETEASPGGISGPISPGTWRAQIDIDYLDQAADYSLEIFIGYHHLKQDKSPAVTEVKSYTKAQAGWYRGELHCHSTESDGKYPVDEVVEAAISENLDFLALTDHFTYSHWKKLKQLSDKPICLIPSVEITSHQGHANMHGLSQWVDVFVDRPDWSMEQAADSTHEQEGLFCVNHPYSNGCGWKDFKFNWHKADLMEIYHNLEGANNNFQLSLWDHLIANGNRLVGVAGTDSHDPYNGIHRLGQLTTWTYASELSTKGITAGLKSGNVFISRGPELRFKIENLEEQTFGMGETATSFGKDVSLCIHYKSREPLRLFIIKDSLVFKSIDLCSAQDQWAEIRVIDLPEDDCYYRLEFHRIDDDKTYPYIQKRDYTTMAALSNPIWVKTMEDNRHA